VPSEAPQNSHGGGKTPCRGNLPTGAGSLSHPEAASSLPPSISPLCPPPHAPHTPSPPSQCLASSPIPTAHPGFPAIPSLHSLFSHPCCPTFIWELHPESTPLACTFTPEVATHVVCYSFHPSSLFLWSTHWFPAHFLSDSLCLSFSAFTHHIREQYLLF
jgi:hypothetical protein